MAVSRNGWSLDPNRMISSVGNDACEVRSGDAGRLLDWFAKQFHAKVEPVDTYNGYRSAAFNKAIGGDARSNHVSATAIDINGARHPYEAHMKAGSWRDGFTATQRTAIRAIIAKTGGAIRWGADFNVGYRDAMHFEVRGTSAEVTRAWRKVKPTPKPVPPQEDDVPKIKTMARSKTTALPANKWKTIPLNNKGGVSALSTPSLFAAQMYLRVLGVPKGGEVQFRFILVDYKKGRPTKVVERGPIQEIIGTAGSAFGVVSTQASLPTGLRLRLQARALNTGVSVRQVHTSTLYWK